jgi:hypothetical protein
MIGRLIGGFTLCVVPLYAIIAAIAGGVSIVPDTPHELIIFAVLCVIALPASLIDPSN